MTEYSARLGRALRQVGPALLEGEVQQIQSRSNGMLYFELTDGQSLLSCKMFRRDAARLEHRPGAGDLVQVWVDRPDFYPARGSLSLIVSHVRLAGEGELLRRRVELIARLSAEGLCDPARRRALPRFPRGVGVIAGQGSDGMSDVIRALTDRWPPVQIVTCNCLVQGTAAPRQLIDAVARLQDHPEVEVIIVARGGGSVQDLACFDDEGLCRALFACAVPVVCAIGHTENNPVCNHVTWPAFTPSRSAELVVPSAAELRCELATLRQRIESAAQRVELAAERVGSQAARLDLAPRLEFSAAQMREVARRLWDGVTGCLAAHHQGVANAHASLGAVSHRAAHGLAAEREALTSAGRALAQCSHRLATVADDVQAVGERVRQGTRRQLADHTHDYGRALQRLVVQGRQGVDRRRARIGEQLHREAGLLAERTHRRLAAVRRDTAHQAELIEARDFRRRGWLLASTERGGPVRSVADLTPASRIELLLHDGRAQAVVENTIHHDGSRSHD